MSDLLPCPSCNRHVRTREATCPFCGVALALQDSPAPPPSKVLLGRAALFAFGASLAGAVTVSCSDTQPVYGAPAPPTKTSTTTTGAGGDVSGSGGATGVGGTSGASGSGGAGGRSNNGR